MNEHEHSTKNKSEIKMPHGGNGHHAHMAADFKKRFWISLILTLPVLFLSPLLRLKK